MSDPTGLEQRYRRLLSCYPRPFRREHEQEMLAVLMAGAGEGQQRPRLGETANLIQHAIWMRLRPRVPRSNRGLSWAVRLMYLCAALKLLGVPILPAAPGSGPHPLHVGVSWGVFGLLAWANGRGHNWARVLFSAWFAFHTLVLFYDIANLSASAPVWTVIAGVVFWLVELAAVVLILSRQSSSFYRRRLRRPSSAL